MSSAARLVAVAAAEVGYREGANNKTKYGAWYGLDNNPWCAMFVSWCAAQAGAPASVIPKFAYVPAGIAFFTRQGRYHSRGSGYLPKTGDIIFYGDQASSGAHVGVVESCSGGVVFAIEGNTSSGGNVSNGEGVYRRARKTSDIWIKGYGSPAYEEEEEMEIKEIRIKQTDSGKTVAVQGFLVDDVTYVRLRDAEKLFPVSVGWDAAEKLATVGLNYKK